MAVKHHPDRKAARSVSGERRSGSPDGAAELRSPAVLSSGQWSREERAALEEMKREYMDYFQPADETESRLVNEMSERQWLLRRLTWIETGLYAMAFRPAGDLASEPRIFTTRELERAISRLRRYESRLLIRFERALFRLNALQRRRPPKPADAQQVAPGAASDPGSESPVGWTM